MTQKGGIKERTTAEREASVCVCVHVCVHACVLACVCVLGTLLVTKYLLHLLEVLCGLQTCHSLVDIVVVINRS